MAQIFSGRDKRRNNEIKILLGFLKKFLCLGQKQPLFQTESHVVSPAFKITNGKASFTAICCEHIFTFSPVPHGFVIIQSSGEGYDTSRPLLPDRPATAG